MKEKIQLTTSTSFQLPEEELKRFYTVMALFQYHHHRKPNYEEPSLLKQLCKDFDRFNAEMIIACKNDPNNLALSKIRNFIEHHYGYIKRFSTQIDELEDE